MGGRQVGVSSPATSDSRGKERTVKVNIHAIQTGTVDIKTAHRVRKPGGLIRVYTDSRWTEWLPIYTWVIDHPEGIIVVDTAETSKSSDPDYYPQWHPFYRGSLRMNVRPEDEIGSQLGRMGIAQIRHQNTRPNALPHRPCWWSASFSRHRDPGIRK
jgi:hypothetical protein